MSTMTQKHAISKESALHITFQIVMTLYRATLAPPKIGDWTIDLTDGKFVKIDSINDSGTIYFNSKGIGYPKDNLLQLVPIVEKVNKG